MNGNVSCISLICESIMKRGKESSTNHVRDEHHVRHVHRLLVVAADDAVVVVAGAVAAPAAVDNVVVVVVVAVGTAVDAVPAAVDIVVVGTEHFAVDIVVEAVVETAAAAGIVDIADQDSIIK